MSYTQRLRLLILALDDARSPEEHTRSYEACVATLAELEADLAAARDREATLRKALERIERLAWPSPQWTTRSTILSVARAALAASPAAGEEARADVAGSVVELRREHG